MKYSKNTMETASSSVGQYGEAGSSTFAPILSGAISSNSSESMIDDLYWNMLTAMDDVLDDIDYPMIALKEKEEEQAA